MKRKEKSGMKRVWAAAEAEDLMKWAVAHERLGTAAWPSMQPREFKKKRKKNPFLLSVLLLQGFRSSKLTPKPACIFHDRRRLTHALLPPALLFLSAPSLTFCTRRKHGRARTVASRSPRALLTYLPKPLKKKKKKKNPSVSPIRSLIRNGISFSAGSRGTETPEWIKESRKWAHECRERLFKACNSGFSSLIIVFLLPYWLGVP